MKKCISSKAFTNRTYRNLIDGDGLSTFTVRVKETDLHFQAEMDLSRQAKEAILKCRAYLETHIKAFPEFATTLVPWPAAMPMPAIIRDMVSAGVAAGVGPMAAVAGAIAEHVGRDLMPHSPRIIVENGGDIFLHTSGESTIGIFAGASPLSMTIGLCIDASAHPMAVCTSSGTIGHSLSMGCADAVCVVSKSAALADATATSIANRVKGAGDIQRAIDFGKTIPGVDGIVVIVDEKIGMWGDIRITALGKKG
ncbi:MAG: UPF0280 family protein [Desulfobacteraceae bacterium]|nr:UPF0280 family protein [Desulfobacteraceae bacterium]